MPFKKIFRKARKAVKKIIPKEVRPFLPYIAAATPGLQGLASGVFANPAAQKALIAGTTRFATDDEADLKDLGITAALAAAPDLIETGSAKLSGKFTPQEYRTLEKGYSGERGPFGGLSELKTVGEQSEIAKSIADAATKVGDVVSEAGPLQTIAAQTGIDAATQLAEIQQDEIDAYNRQLAEQGIRDKAERRAAIRNIYTGIGYDEGYVDSMLDRYGYASGGSTYTMDDILDMASEATKKKRKEREEEDEDELSEYIDIGSRGLMSLAPKQKPMPIRPLQMAEGGMMNLGGNEMDLRGGGFVPIGKKEKADDVPARLSKNEFVMTADAVRGAGNGDINEGARRMYQTMDKLEAMA